MVSILFQQIQTGVKSNNFMAIREALLHFRARNPFGQMQKLFIDQNKLTLKDTSRSRRQNNGVGYLILH